MRPDAQDADVFILTLEMDDDSFNLLNGLRAAHFPRERNLIPAHLTLFHRLDVEQCERMAQEITAEPQQSVALNFSGVRSLGRGVAIEVTSPALTTLRARLARAAGGGLSAQDNQGYRPHVTVQNKVEPEHARQLLAELSRDWMPRTGEGRALLLWRYLGGPWELRERWELG